MDKVKELVSQMTNDVFSIHFKWAIDLVEKKEFAFAAGMFSILLEECLMAGNKLSIEKYEQLHSELEKLILKFCDNENETENKEQGHEV